MPSFGTLRRAFSRRSVFLASMLLAVVAVVAACGDDNGERDFAEAISEQNQQWVEQAERPLADLVLRIASQPASIADRRSEIVATLDAALALSEQTLSATRGLQAPNHPARQCQEAQVQRLESERSWVSGLRLAIGQMADASAVAMLPTFRELGATIASADEACSSFLEQVN